MEQEGAVVPDTNLEMGYIQTFLSLLPYLAGVSLGFSPFAKASHNRADCFLDSVVLIEGGADTATPSPHRMLPRVTTHDTLPSQNSSSSIRMVGTGNKYGSLRQGLQCILIKEGAKCL